jgi:hypothetical protein
LVRLFLLLGLVIFLNSCAFKSIQGSPKYYLDAKDNELAKIKDDANGRVDETSALNPEKKRQRDKIIYARLRLIDINYHEFIEKLLAENKIMNIGTDSLISAISTYGTLIKPVDAKNIASGIVTAISGVRDSIDKNAYLNSSAMMLISYMNTNRAKVLSKILSHMSRRNYKDYTISKAKFEIDEYYQAGTLHNAIESMNESFATFKKDAKTEIKTNTDNVH